LKEQDVFMFSRGKLKPYDLDIVIDIATTDLPGLQAQIEGILQELNSDEP
jgi:uncharacterized protein with HEPN domain